MQPVDGARSRVKEQFNVPSLFAQLGNFGRIKIGVTGHQLNLFGVFALKSGIWTRVAREQCSTVLIPLRIGSASGLWMEGLSEVTVDAWLWMTFCNSVVLSASAV
jgi:hypothetical protein